MSAPFPRAPHDHTGCVTDALHAADGIAKAHGLRFTALRRKVLEIVLSSHRPVGAYDVLAELARADKTSKPAPPTVYRALDFLLAHGFVHRIDSLNAYAACFAPTRRHATHFLLCRACGRAAEIENAALSRALEHAASLAHFAIERETVEITGLCAECAQISPSIAGGSR